VLHELLRPELQHHYPKPGSCAFSSHLLKACSRLYHRFDCSPFRYYESTSRFTSFLRRFSNTRKPNCSSFSKLPPISRSDSAWSAQLSSAGYHNSSIAEDFQISHTADLCANEESSDPRSPVHLHRPTTQRT
jgi:hypothetical protein